MAQPGDFAYQQFGTGQGPGIIGADVASVAGVITPSGPYFRVTGALAITGINVPTEVSGGGYIWIMPTGAFTWTVATNIAVAGTAVVSRILGFFWNPVTAKWYPTYV
jgi:hypothetical protein